MKNGIKVEIMATFESENAQFYGPTDRVFLGGRIYDKEGELLREWILGDQVIPLYGSAQFVHNQKNQIIEIKIKPKVK